MSYQFANQTESDGENPCLFCQTGEHCNDCTDNPGIAIEKRRYSFRHVPMLVDRIVNTMMATRVDGITVSDMFDAVEIADVAEEYHSLKKEIGRRLQPEEKCKLIITAAAWHWLRRDNLTDYLCKPLQHYPEIAVDPVGIGKPQYKPDVKVREHKPKTIHERLTPATVKVKANNIKMKLPHLTVECVGSWIWIGGATYADAKTLKSFGAAWSKNSGKWFVKGVAVSCKKSMGYIHAATKYGTEEI